MHNVTERQNRVKSNKLRRGSRHENRIKMVQMSLNCGANYEMQPNIATSFQ